MEMEKFDISELAQMVVAMENRLSELVERLALFETWGDNVRYESCKRKIESCKSVLEKFERMRV